MTTTADKALIRATPCDNCPWRAEFHGDDDYLRPGRRAGILLSLQQGGFFPCHKTTVPDDNDSDMVPTADSVECAGSVLMMLREMDAPFVIRLVDKAWIDEFLERNDGVELWTYADVAADNGEAADDVEPCNTVDHGCLAPAGYMTGGGVVHGTVSADGYCDECGEPLCSNCATDDGICPGCADR
jgi:hypothetical protein